MLLKLSTWQEIDDYLKQSKAIIVPIGSTEQHGPMGMIGTDAICPETIAAEISRREEILVAPTIHYGMSQHHLAFSGSITLRPATLISMIRDIVHSLAVHGFTHLLFYNGHGGNVSPVKTAFSEIYTQYSLAGSPCDLRCELVNWYDGRRVKELQDIHFKSAEGSHATPAEISLSFYAHPEAVKSAELSPRIAPDGDFRDAADFRSRFPDGRIGSDSGLATVEIGKELCRAAVADLRDAYHHFINADSPDTDE